MGSGIARIIAAGGNTTVRTTGLTATATRGSRPDDYEPEINQTPGLRPAFAQLEMDGQRGRPSISARVS